MVDASTQSGFRPPTLEQLRRMPHRQVVDLAKMIRARLVEVVAANGGHLAPNLGVVELTLALHRTFVSPRDRIVWDVGHQSYVHKMLTGRWDDLASVRQFGGLAGFPKRAESPHDAFDTGHASTSISAALGMAKARDLQGAANHVVAVIGDGALTGGMAFEALNHAGQAETRLVIVLNDNSMSISRSVGGLAAYLARVRTHPAYSRTKQDVKSWLSRLPGGEDVTALLGRLRTSLKYLLIPGVFFEELGITYLGPVDGHDVAQVEEALRQAKALPGPSVVHCLTRKGKGYGPAEANPRRFHGIGPFDPTAKTGAVSPAAGPPSFSDAFGNALTAAAAKDARICAITAAMPDGTGLTGFFKRFPQRSFDVCIAEQHAVTFAAGLAAAGMRPVAAIYSTFLQRAYDQVLHDVCLQRLPVLLALDRAGIVGEDGETHHGLYDLAYLRSMPGMVIAVPRDEPTLVALLELGLSHDGPFAMRYPRGRVPAKPLAVAQPDELQIGRGQLLRDGGDLAILAVGPLVYASLAAADALADQGIEVTVADARFVKPLDLDLLDQLLAGNRPLLVAEEAIAAGGLAGAVLEAASARYAGVALRIKALGLPDSLIPHGDAAQLRRAYGLDAEGIVAAASALLAESRP